MKTIFFPLFFLCSITFFLKSANNDAVREEALPALHFEKKTKPVLFEYTSTGCPGCGSWGKPTFYNLIKAHQDQITPLAIHIKYNDAMITPYSTELGNNRHGMFFTPQIWVNDSNAVVILDGRIHPSSTHKATQLIHKMIQKEQPAVAVSAIHQDAKIKVDFGAHFFDLPKEGQYSLACYINENDLEHFQAGYSANPAKHHHVIRDAASGTYGFSFTKNDLQNESYFASYEFDKNTIDNLNNAYVTVVLWEKINGRYTVLNSNSSLIQ